MNEDDDFVMVLHSDAGGFPTNPSSGYLAEISDCIDQISNELWGVNQHIHDNPELGYQEYDAHKILTRFMQSRQGWNVTTSAYKMETAWVAVFDSGRVGPVVSFNVEMGQ
jgi:metal-dependent amidase/aminoacylase/carboxypeptidase family protein